MGESLGGAESIMTVRVPVLVRRENGRYVADCMAFGIKGEGATRVEAIELMRAKVREHVRRTGR